MVFNSDKELNVFADDFYIEQVGYKLFNKCNKKC